MITVWTFCLGNLSVEITILIGDKNGNWIANDMAATLVVGKLEEFNPNNDLITAYVECAQLFIEANAIPTEKLQRF